MPASLQSKSLVYKTQRPKTNLQDPGGKRARRQRSHEHERRPLASVHSAGSPEACTRLSRPSRRVPREEHGLPAHSGCQGPDPAATPKGHEVSPRRAPGSGGGSPHGWQPSGSRHHDPEQSACVPVTALACKRSPSRAQVGCRARWRPAQTTATRCGRSLPGAQETARPGMGDDTRAPQPYPGASVLEASLPMRLPPACAHPGLAPLHGSTGKRRRREQPTRLHEARGGHRDAPKARPTP